MKEDKLGFLVGLFIILGLILFAGAIVLIKSELLEDTYKVTGVFNYAGGLKTGTPVRLAGVEIGRVNEIVISQGPKTRIEVIMAVNDAYRIKKDARLYVESVGIIGEKVLEFTIGSATETDIPTDGSAVIEGVVPPTLSDIQQNINDLSSYLKVAVGQFSELISSPEVQKGFKDTMTNAADMTRKGSETMDDIKNIVAKSSDFLDKANKFAETFAGVAAKADEIVGVKVAAFGDKAVAFGDKMNTVADEVNLLVKDLRDVKSELSGAIGRADSSFKGVSESVSSGVQSASEDVKRLAGNIEKNSATLQELVESLRNTARKIEESEGSLSLFVNKKDFYEKSVDLVSSMKEAVKNINDTVTFLREHPESLIKGAMAEDLPSGPGERDIDVRNRR